jgi:predicted RecA/RadA family phage recombinase
MATAIYWHKGEAIDYTNTTDEKIAAGQIVSLGTRIGVAGADIAPNETGSLFVKHVFKMPKATGAITLGAAVYYNETDGTISTESSGNIPAGWAASEAAENDSTVLVSI